MLRRAIAGLIVVGLGVGIWVLWPRQQAVDPTPTTVVLGGPTTSTGSDGTTTTLPDPTSTTTTEGSHVVETVEEAEAILRELWFGWFEGIYNQDEERIREVVATEEQVEDGVDAFELLHFSREPEPSGIRFAEIELVHATNECLAIWSTSNVDFLPTGPDRSGLDIIRRLGDRWVLMSSWEYKEDLWEQDCESVLQPSP